MSLAIAETRKLTTVWTTTVITLVGLLLVLFGAAFFVFESEFSGEFLGTDGQVAAAIDQIGGMSVIALIVGLLSVTTEFRHETIGRTLQLTPSRTRVVVTKMMVGALYGVVFFALGLVVVGAILLLSGTELDLGEAVVAALWQGPVGLALMAVFGVAVGALLRSQVVAVALMLIYVFIIESLVMQFLPDIGRWLPFQALNALFLSEELTAGMGVDAAAPLAPMVGLAVFVAYFVVAATAAIVLMRVRDV
jgi:ABC-type transport system involved in multi-copper enzyme maturation permease subunit